MQVLLLALFDEWCLGLRQISAMLKREGHNVTLAYLGSLPEMHGTNGLNDPEGYHAPPSSVSGADFKALQELVQRIQPDIIGLGFTSAFSGLAAEATARMRKVSDAVVVWGGIDVTANPDLAIKHADFVCIGEGDEAVVDLANALVAGADVTNIPNIWAKRNDEIFKNKARPLIQDLDRLPFADHDPSDKYWISEGIARANVHHPRSHLQSSYPIMTTRGCPYSCSFCCNSFLRDMYGNKDFVRMRSVPNVIRELNEYIARNPQTQWIEVWDDVFGVNMDWAEEFGPAYRDNVGLPFWCYTYPSFIKPRLIEALKVSGIGYIVMGIQSGSQRILNEVYNRKTPVNRVIESARMILDAGITLLIDLIDGYPFQKEEDNWQTLELLLQMPQGVILQPINRLSVYRNYPIADRVAEAGIQMTMLEGRNSCVFEDTQESLFWKGILTIAQFHHKVGAENLRNMARDPYLREHPEVVLALADTLVDAAFLPGTRIARSEQHRQMMSELDYLRAEVAALRGSRIVRTALKVRDMVGRGEGSGNGKKKVFPTGVERSARAIMANSDQIDS